jgi:DNA-binding CsgD family transcriptional regulator
MLFADQDLDIIACFELMDRGGSPISQAVSQSFLRALACRGQGGSAPADSPLSGRETEVLRLMARGASTEEIGQLLALSRNTVISHAKSIYRKLDVHSRAEALAAAASRRLLG